ncbi:hypothetical protein BGW38_002805 [Lunasporangiospora selenospora]|uniref:Uncharacterized protein n=1 Tax=Lunasporangiospora selenospora TaxID=979761 RepID=A0A9P6G1H6_9FUNG|nr:hypothetical protein BGW38_002805 [Lunasporangiospora selenospora]
MRPIYSVKISSPTTFQATLLPSRPPHIFSISNASCLKVAAAITIMSHVTIADACSPTTLDVKWEQFYQQDCSGGKCISQSAMKVTYDFYIRDRYHQSFTQVASKKSSASGIPKACIGDGNYCVKFNSPTNVELFYANKKRKYTKTNKKTGNSQYGGAEYYDCV